MKMGHCTDTIEQRLVKNSIVTVNAITTQMYENINIQVQVKSLLFPAHIILIFFLRLI